MINREFQFNRIEFQHDSYEGINIKLKYLLRVEMVYQSTLMKSTLVEDHPVIIRNKLKIDTEEIALVHPMLTITYQPEFHPDPPLILELLLKKAKVNIDNEFLEGQIKFKDST